jgi:hypothetical protein
MSSDSIPSNVKRDYLVINVERDCMTLTLILGWVMRNMRYLSP